MSSNVKISVLDLMPHRPDQSQHQTMLNTIDAARAAESYGYERFWVAEHHNAGSLLSSATVVVMAEIAAATERIRVGSGGIMLPNHAPYVVAEQFGTLNAFHPGRIDLGVGRAPGTDPMTAAALRRDDSAAMSFPAEVQQLQRFLGEPPPCTACTPSRARARRFPCTFWVLPCSARSLPRSWVCPTRSLRILRPQCCRRR